MATSVRRMDRSALVNPVTNYLHEPMGKALAWPVTSLKLLSFNIQVGVKTSAYRQYFTKGWKHLLPHGSRHKNLGRIARIISEYDLVALQEVDSGSIRSGFVNQVEYLSNQAGFPYWYAQINRDVGPLAQHGNGVLSRIQPAGMEDHKLPGRIPGRGAMFLRIPHAGEELLVVMLHLSLGRQSRQRQLSYIAEQIAGERQVILMGDMNTHSRHLLENSPLKHLDLTPADQVAPTYPAWQPSVALDHVLVSSSLEIRDYQVLTDCRLSDHLPIAVEVAPKSVPTLQ